MAVMAPVMVPALATDYEPKRTKNVGSQVEMPPTAKVHMARPRVAVQNAGLWARPESVVRLRLGANSSALRVPAPGPRTEGEGDEDSGQRGDEEGHAPAVVLAEDASHEIAERAADGDGDVEDAEDAVAVDLGVEIGEQGGRVDAECCLADADDGVANEQGLVAVDRGGVEGRGAPEECSGDDERLARDSGRRASR